MALGFCFLWKNYAMVIKKSCTLPHNTQEMENKEMNEEKPGVAGLQGAQANRFFPRI
jgi:hypothetical protein